VWFCGLFPSVKALTLNSVALALKISTLEDREAVDCVFFKECGSFRISMIGIDRVHRAEVEKPHGFIMPWPSLCGFVILALLWFGPLPALSRTAFSPGMIAHLGVVAAAAPLIAYGFSRGQRCLIPAVLALCAMTIDMAIVLGWHVPYFHDWAATDWRVYAVEQISFLAVGFIVWYAAFHSAPLLGAATLFLVFMHMTLLGSFLAISSRTFYDPDICRGAFGFTPLADQRFGGVLMASWGALVYLAGSLVLFHRAVSGATD
jgi:putative membrane protein